MVLDKEVAKAEILELVKNYSNNKDRLKYDSETDTRVKFIDRLFEFLGWDVFGYKIQDEVQREEGIRDKNQKTKKADYVLRINGIPRIIVEAKAAGISLDDPVAIRQAVSYAANKVCSWAVLTNFNRVIIFYVDRKGDTPFYRIELSETVNYESEFEKLWFLSKESVFNNLLEKEARNRGLRADKIPINQQLLFDLKLWRESLSEDIKKRYGSEYKPYVIDEIVQKIIDRLIFIRKTEDARMEEPKLQQLLARPPPNIYSEIKNIFIEYMEKYDSKLFGEDRKNRHECDKVELTNSVIEEVVHGMHRSRGSDIEYDFSIIDSDVLGSIYEQYLGYVLEQSQRKVSLEGGISHRKEQGIYYTPVYITEFITRSTLGEVLKKTKIKDAGKLKILDPACGSGSFLIKAFDLLNNFYAKDSKSYGQTKLDFSGGITFSKKVEILQNNIFGVDLDSKAVEISQLNLLLKIAERGNRLPVLQKNIQVGNSIIDDELLVGESAFKWKEKFSNIMKDGGFDVILGNPPYFNIKSDSELRKLDDYRLLSNGVVNIAAMFVKRSIDLLKPKGYLGFIIPKSFAYVDSWKPLRDFIFNNTQLLKVVDVSKAFKDVLLEQLIIVIRKQKSKKTDLVEIISDFNSPTQTINQVEYGSIIFADRINFSSSEPERTIHYKMNNHSTFLGEISENFRGIGAQKVITKEQLGGERILSGKEVQKYSVSDYHNYFIRHEDLAKYGGKVNRLRQPKIMAQNIVAHIRDHIKIIATYDSEGILNLDTVNNLTIKDRIFRPKYILALLNSRLISYYTYNFIYSKAIRTMHFDGSYSGKIPIKKIPLEDQDYFEKIVDRLLELNLNLLKLGDKQIFETEKIKEEIEDLKCKMDSRIYHLYRLDENEIQIVKNSFQ